MDGTRFDAWTKALAGGRSRRGAQAVSGFVGEPCRINGECCHGASCRGGTCQCRPNHTDCNGRCRDLRFNERHCGACNTPCAAGETCCRRRCVDVATDAANCGRCGNACGADQVCAGGVCGPVCRGGVAVVPTGCCSCLLADFSHVCIEHAGDSSDCRLRCAALSAGFSGSCTRDAGDRERCNCDADGLCWWQGQACEA